VLLLNCRYYNYAYISRLRSKKPPGLQETRAVTTNVQYENIS